MIIDLEAARRIDDNLPLGNDQQMINAAKLLPAALDEIDRLQKQSMHGCISCRSEAYREGQESQAKRIAELEGNVKSQSEIIKRERIEITNRYHKQRAAIKILGKRSTRPGRTPGVRCGRPKDI